MNKVDFFLKLELEFAKVVDKNGSDSLQYFVKHFMNIECIIFSLIYYAYSKDLQSIFNATSIGITITLRLVKGVLSTDLKYFSCIESSEASFRGEIKLPLRFKPKKRVQKSKIQGAN